ncbi:hypothetical protein AB684_11045 [Bacillus licheniformis]|uniref:Uncharacterized protein n=1 Tax=Bacillus glycinifermentans TaxID=1664069 RepID=A0A0T6BV45_9BACI|nr:hypothetical protein AB684_11045 [Bacillus licheniformis]KRT95503.1 hypothetical protein AB447_209380 [Bacillus glycinifermentans]ARC67947.1 hypothetical protein B34_00504 [Bacillus licheniformis]AVI45451.1 hypothetical protein BL14DL4_00185 [Bacillus licheniformis]KJH58781.1 hypothetical protein UF14_10295 [Bacillus licheniformis]
MINFTSKVLEIATHFSVFLIVFLGCLTTVIILLCPIWLLLNNILYKRTKASIYFVSYIKNRHAFMEWKKEKKTKVYKPSIKK